MVGCIRRSIEISKIFKKGTPVTKGREDSSQGVMSLQGGYDQKTAR